MAIRANIAIGEVKGINEQTLMSVLSIFPPDMENITIINPDINSIVIGITEVLISSSLEAVEPIAPYIKAYIKKPSTIDIIGIGFTVDDVFTQYVSLLLLKHIGQSLISRG